MKDKANANYSCASEWTGKLINRKSWNFNYLFSRFLSFARIIANVLNFNEGNRAFCYEFIRCR